MSIVVAGHTGLVGSAIFELLKERREDVIGINSKVLNLLDRTRTFEFISDVKPTMVIDAAAIVGGIGDNYSRPVEFLSHNLQIQTNLMDAANQAKVERFVFLGSSCIYPRDCPQPIKEEYLMTGPLEKTNSAYAIAKIAGIEMIRSYRRQFNRRWISVMPTNLYGPGDNFDANASHVLPSFVRKFVDAQKIQKSSVELWGDGSPLRDFLHAQDCARAILLAAEKYDCDLHLNIGSSEEITIRDLATTISTSTGYKGQIKWNASKPNGTPRKILDSARIRSLGWVPKISLKEGIQSTIDWYKSAVELGVARL